MVRNYKTGPRRSRRRADPSTVWNGSQVIFPPRNEASSGGAGTIDVELQLVDPATANDYQGGEARLTGKDPGYYVVNSLGVRTPITGVDVTPDGSITADQVTGLSAGSHFIVLPGLDQGVRIGASGFVGTLFFLVTVS